MPQPQPQPQPRRSASTSRSGQRKTEPPKPTDDRSTIKIASWLALGYCAYSATFGEFSNIPQLLMFGAALSMGLGGFATLMKGDAEIKLGGWFTASGYLAAFIFITMLILYSLGIIKFPNFESTSLKDALVISAAIFQAIRQV